MMQDLLHIPYCSWTLMNSLQILFIIFVAFFIYMILDKLFSKRK